MYNLLNLLNPTSLYYSVLVLYIIKLNELKEAIFPDIIIHYSKYQLF